MVLFLPLLAFFVAFGLHFLNKVIKMNDWWWLLINPFIIGLLAYLSLLHLVDYGTIHYTVLQWLNVGDFNVSFGVLLDHLSKAMLVVVACISFLVHIFAAGYMSNSPRAYLFLSYISLFTFFMTLLVVADNFIQLFFGWEGVGFVSFLLIGFYNTKAQAGLNANKAFIVNRVADSVFIIGIGLVLTLCHSMYFDEVFNNVKSVSKPLISLIALCLFLGAAGKSAQFGLHVWLPDAMIAPTPTSILLHAATMVAAGVFLMARIAPVLDLSYYVNTFIAYIGLMTAFYAGTVALCQNDIKKIVAYSTCSQLGYMFLAIGVSSYSGAMFHLTTHAFFKALLFACAGIVICYMGGNQDIRKMGNMYIADRWLCICMWIGTLSLAGIPLFAGSVSKDYILTSVITSHVFGHSFLYYGGVFCAFLTALYSSRLMFKVFHSPCSEPVTMPKKWDYNCMILPVIVTTIFAIFGGKIFKGYFVHGHHHHVALIYELLPPIASSCGLFLSFLLFFAMPHLAKKIGFQKTKLFLEHRWYIDNLYHTLFVKSSMKIGAFCAKFIDILLIDRIGVLAWRDISKYLFVRLNALSSGRIRTYLTCVLISICCGVIFVCL